MSHVSLLFGVFSVGCREKKTKSMFIRMAHSVINLKILVNNNLKNDKLAQNQASLLPY